MYLFQKESIMSEKIRNKSSQRSPWDISRYEFVDSTGTKWAVSLELKALKGRVVPISLLIEPIAALAELNTEVLHELSIQKIVKPWIEAEQKRVAQENMKRKVAAHSGRPHSEEELQTVADVYLVAYEKSLPVQQTVAQALGIPISTAAKRIMAARQQGLIPKGLNRKKSA
jgi:hypothetical protein